MTVWLSNLAAYSVQLAVLVGTAIVLLTIVRVEAPRATLRFWQSVLAASVLLPLFQLWAGVANRTITSSAGGAASTDGDVLWNAVSSSVAGVRADITTLDPDAARWLIGVLVAGAMLKLGWVALGLISLRAIRAAAEPTRALDAVAAPLQRELDVDAIICFSDAVGSPATIGARHPIVLLPHRVRDLAAPVQRAVLCHELIHVRRRDWLPALLEELCCAVFWFHPAARALASRLSMARETLVDEATIAHTGDRRAYAAALLEFSSAGPRLAGATALIGRRHLERRIALIAQEVPMPHSSLFVRLVVAGAIVAGATLAASASMPINVSLQAQTEKVYKNGDGVTLPQIATEVKPEYTPAALQAGIQGSLQLTVVVLADGKIGNVTVARSLDTEYGLDAEAVKAMRQWTFAPGTKDGKAVPVEITVGMTFTLK